MTSSCCTGASKVDCDVCPFKMRCCPKEPARKIPRSITSAPWPDQLPREFGCSRAVPRRLSALCEDDVRGVRGGNVLGAFVAKLRCVDSNEKVFPRAEEDR
jgi:hypothetical protein